MCRAFLQNNSAVGTAACRLVHRTYHLTLRHLCNIITRSRVVDKHNGWRLCDTKSNPVVTLLAAGATGGSGRGNDRQRCSGRTIKQSIVHNPAAVNFKVLGQPRSAALSDHGSRVAAHEHGLVCLKAVVVVEVVRVLVTWDGALVDSELPVVLTERLQLPWKLEEPARSGC